MSFSFGDFNLNSLHQVQMEETSEARLISKFNYYQRSRFQKSKRSRFYLLDIEKLPESFKLTISGSTRNIYQVTVSEDTHKLSCDCPDGSVFCQGNNTICKHSYFVLFKIMKMWKLAEEENSFFTTNVLSSTDMTQINEKLMELYNRFNITTEDTYISPNLSSKYHRFKDTKTPTGGLADEVPAVENKFTCLEITGEESACPICYNDYDSQDKIVKCPCCGNKFHQDCMDRWLKMGKTSCVFCRSEVWQEYIDLNLNINYIGTEYMNLNRLE